MQNVINIESAKDMHSIEGTPVLLYSTSNLASQLGNRNVKSVPKLLHIVLPEYRNMSSFGEDFQTKYNVIPYDFRLEGTASYQTDNGIKSLHLDGRSGYAEIPAINFRRSSFSIALRFKVHDSYNQGHLLSDWSSPWQFRLYVYDRKVYVELRRSGEVQTVLFMASDRLVNVFIPPVLEYQVKELTIHDKIAPTGLRGHQKLSDI